MRGHLDTSLFDTKDVLMMELIIKEIFLMICSVVMVNIIPKMVQIIKETLP